MLNLRDSGNPLQDNRFNPFTANFSLKKRIFLPLERFFEGFVAKFH